MAKRSDTTRPHSVKAEFDNNESATPNGGAVLIEKALRSLNLNRLIKEHLPARKETADYSTFDIVYPFVAGLMLGGRGMIAAETLRPHALDQAIFGLEKDLPTEGTMHNALADLAGLPRRDFDEVYAPAGLSHPSLDIFGQVKSRPARRRLVPERAESARTRARLDAFTAAVARRCLQAVARRVVVLDGYAALFGDATQLEVEGRCFDAAVLDRNGKRSLQWATLMLGPILVAQGLDEGSAFEAGRLKGLVAAAAPAIGAHKGPRGVLALNDAAYFHQVVVNDYEARRWKYIMSANLYRSTLENIVRPLHEALWKDLGPDARRGWEESGVYVFSHRPGGWKHESTIVAVRWRASGDLPGVWRYSFLATNLTGADLPGHRVKEFGFGQYVRMLYGTKQGREDHYKTALEDFNLHHPPSGRLGINEVFYALAVAAVNVAMVIRYRVLKGEDRGMRFWRFRERYVRLAGGVKRAARALTSVLFGKGVDVGFQTLWLSAFAEAGFL